MLRNSNIFWQVQDCLINPSVVNFIVSMKKPHFQAVEADPNLALDIFREKDGNIRRKLKLNNRVQINFVTIDKNK